MNTEHAVRGGLVIESKFLPSQLTGISFAGNIWPVADRRLPEAGTVRHWFRCMEIG